MGWETIRVGSRTLGSPTPARSGLGGTHLGSPWKWLGISLWILAVICDVPR